MLYKYNFEYILFNLIFLLKYFYFSLIADNITNLCLIEALHR